MRINRYVMGAVAAGALGAGGAAVAVSTSGAVAEDLPSARVAQAPSQTLPDLVLKTLKRSDSAVAEYGLDASAARSVELPSGDTVWITPGKSGSCLWDANASGSCASTSQVAEGKLALIGLPPIEGKITPGESVRLRPGPLTVVGYAPDGVTEVTVTDDTGLVVERAKPTEGFYELSVGQQAGWKSGAGWAIELERGEKRALKVAL